MNRLEHAIKAKKSEEERIAPIKDLETLIRAIKLVKKDVDVEIVGPAEEDYLSSLKRQIRNMGLKNIRFTGPIYNSKEKIKKIDSARVFVLPSKREAMPQALIEAMARGKIVVASNNPGTRDIIDDGKNGLLFKVGDQRELAEKMQFAMSKKADKIKKSARKSVEKFSWKKVIQKLERIIISNI